MNYFWQADLAQFFDLTFLDQREPVERLQKNSSELKKRVHWLPLAADPATYRKLPREKVYDLTFVGTVNPRLRPKRSWILEELRRHFDVAIFQGQNRRSLLPAEVVEIYNQSRLILNENLFPGLNLRLFEAMICGTCVLTEESDGSWKSFFEDGTHLLTYNPKNLLDRVHNFLEDESGRERIAQQGRLLVQQEHTIESRTHILLRIVQDCLSKNKRSYHHTRRVFHLGKSCLTLAQRWPGQPVGRLAPEGMRLLWSEVSNERETADLHFELAAQAMVEERLQHALASLRRALELDPTHLRSMWGLFWCLRETGDQLNANLEINRFCQNLRAPTADQGLRERVRLGREFTADDYCYLGALLEKAGWRYEPGVERSGGPPCRWNAVDIYQKAISLDPELELPYLRCAEILANCGCGEFALAFVEKAVKLRPQHANLRWKLAHLLLNAYRRKEGVQQIREYLTLSTEAEKWEKVEELDLTETEWAALLNAIHAYSRKSQAIASNMGLSYDLGTGLS